MELPVFDKHTSPDVVIGALRREGAAVVTSVVNNDIVDACNAELRTEFDARGQHLPPTKTIDESSRLQMVKVTRF